MDINLFPAMVEAAVAAFLVAFAQMVDALVAPTCALAAAALTALVAIVFPRATLSSAKEVRRFAAEPAPEPEFTNPYKIWEFVLPEHIAVHFPKGVDYGVVGGQARVAAYCLFTGAQWPEGYRPRDQDYLILDPSIPYGQLRGEGLPGLDVLAAKSFHSYCHQLDLTSNGVMVREGVLYMDNLAREAFLSGEVGLRYDNPAFKRGVSGFEYLCLRAAVQTGWDVRVGAYHPRAGALALDTEILAGLVGIEETHWYWETYVRKLEQVKSGNH